MSKCEKCGIGTDWTPQLCSVCRPKNSETDAVGVLTTMISDYRVEIKSLRQSYDTLKDERGALRSRVEELEARLADYEADRAHVLAEQCAPDEKHCTCVPELQKSLRKAEANLGLSIEQGNKAVRERDEARAEVKKLKADTNAFARKMVEQSTQELRAEVERLKAELVAVTEGSAAKDEVLRLAYRELNEARAALAEEGEKI